MCCYSIRFCPVTSIAMSGMAGFRPPASIPTAISRLDEALTFLRDGTIFPHINRADFAVTIYPPVAQFFFLIVTWIGESVTMMRLALLGCESVTVH